MSDKYKGLAQAADAAYEKWQVLDQERREMISRSSSLRARGRTPSRQAQASGREQVDRLRELEVLAMDALNDWMAAESRLATFNITTRSKQRAPAH